jgi:hypothetical protein
MWQVGFKELIPMPIVRPKDTADMSSMANADLSSATTAHEYNLISLSLQFFPGGLVWEWIYH